MERDPIQNDIRRARRERRLGPGAVCLLCGETDSEVLIKHHILGRANDKYLIGDLCRNCHEKAHEAERTSPEAFISQLRERGRALCKWADLLEASLRCPTISLSRFAR